MPDATSLNDLVHHADVIIGLFQLGRCDPDLSICRNVLARSVQYFACVVVAFQSC